jgi:hypothetical protein
MEHHHNLVPLQGMTRLTVLLIQIAMVDDSLIVLQMVRLEEALAVEI